MRLYSNNDILYYCYYYFNFRLLIVLTGYNIIIIDLNSTQIQTICQNSKYLRRWLTLYNPTRPIRTPVHIHTVVIDIKY